MTSKDKILVHHIDVKKPYQGKGVMVYASGGPDAHFRVLYRIGDMWYEAGRQGAVAACVAWPWWCSVTPVRRAFRSAFHRAGR